MRLVLICAVSTLFVACVSAREVEELRIEDPVALITAQHMSGDLEIVGRNNLVGADVAATVWGRGSSRDAAERRQERVRWSAEVLGDELALSSLVTENRAGVDFFITAPTQVDTVLTVDRGDVFLNDVEGIHDIVASSVRGVAIGDVVVDASSRVDLDFYPYDTTAADISSQGAVTLALPYGLDYDLVVRGNPDAEMVVEELGWDDVRLSEGFFAGYRGRGGVRINVFADGPIEIVEAR